MCGCFENCLGIDLGCSVGVRFGAASFSCGITLSFTSFVRFEFNFSPALC